VDEPTLDGGGTVHLYWHVDCLSERGLSERTFAVIKTFILQLGFHRFTPYDFHCLFHFWRTIGYCLGIEDRFNLCDGADEETVAICRHMFQEHWLPKIRSEEERTGVEMARGIALAMARMSPIINYNALLHYSASFMGLDKSKYPLVGGWDRLSYVALVCIYRHLSHSVAMCWCVSAFSRFRMWIAVKLRNYHQRALKKLYSKKSYDADERCPFGVEINYTNAFESKLY